MTEEAILIFVRKPERGKVKTRLAAAVGNDAALAVYQKLLAHTKAITCTLSCDKYVFYASDVHADDLWREGFTKNMQSGADLGERMKAAFAALFAKDYQRLVLIGSDCLDLTTPVIQNAFDALRQVEVVVGPAADGGYYLIGMRNNVKDIFDGVDWSTEAVFRQTMEKLEHLNLAIYLLPVLSDVDRVEDLPAGFLET